MSDYDSALEKIIGSGKLKRNRTGIDTLSLFGITCRYDLSNYFPILTRRAMHYNSVFAELLWFLEGSTNINRLNELGCHYWDKWNDPVWQESKGYTPGSLGPVYGFQLRHFGGTYDLLFQGIDQLALMRKLLTEEPESRRNLFNLWNPPDIRRSKLPPCHLMFQVDVTDGRLNGCLTQRSADFAVGVPSNIQFYAGLIWMLCLDQNLYHNAKLRPGTLVHNTVDSHVYVNQIDQVSEYLARPIRDSPRLIGCPGFCDYYTKEDVNAFGVTDYNPESAIRIPVAV